jgi:hypothetical protein
MSHTYDDVKKMTVAQLREVAAELDHPAVQGYSQLRKDKLFPAVCEALGLEAKAKAPKKKGGAPMNRAAMKAKIKDLKVQREAAKESGDSAQLKIARRRIQRLKRRIRKTGVSA